MPRILTVIPAKGRSRRLPGKNATLLAGKPLVVHAIEQAKASGVCGEICVYTDTQEIADVARQAGASVPFLRVGDVDDMTSAGQAACNLLRRYREELGRTFDIVGLLLTTSPLRAPEDIRGCYEVLDCNSNLDASMSFHHVEKHPYWAWTENADGNMAPLFPGLCDVAREDAPKPYFVDGAVYFARAEFFERVNGDQYKGRVGGYTMPAERAIDVDTKLDLDFCEYLLTKGS
ncbi:cytidylyltransferase domain-containing protein [Pseudomonadota bacterium]